MSRGLFGSLDLSCLRDAHGNSFLARQFCQPPFHVGKGYRYGELLSVQVANPATGVFCGDSLSVNVEVDAGSLRVSTPAATSLFPGKGTACIRQKLSVSNSGWLEWLPEPIIPHAGARLDQSLEVSVNGKSGFFGAETLAPGRVAKGESLAYEKLVLRGSFSLDGKAILRERLAFEPPETDWMLKRFGWAAAYLTTAWVCFREPLEKMGKLAASLEGLQTDSYKLGASSVQPRWLVIRAVGVDSVVMRAGLVEIRRLLSEKVPELAVETRRL